jgi:hypothetical protein
VRAIIAGMKESGGIRKVKIGTAGSIAIDFSLRNQFMKVRAQL